MSLLAVVAILTGMGTTIPQRPLGATGIDVSSIGLGCNRIGSDLLTDAEWMSLLHRAADLGVTLYDTAQQYARGRSQELIGKAFGNRPDVVIATKITPVEIEGGRGFTYRSMIEGTEHCLRVLNRETIDVLQTHGSGDLEEVQNDELIRAFEDLVTSGKIRARASATFDATGSSYAMENRLTDVLQITYNLIDRSHALPLLPTAREHRTGILARMPYQRGSLTGKFRPGQPVPEGHRALLQREQLQGDIERAAEFADLAAGRPGGMAELAMQYVLQETSISSVIPGARSVEQLEANIRHGLADPLSPDELAEIARIQNGAA